MYNIRRGGRDGARLKWLQPTTKAEDWYRRLSLLLHPINPITLVLFSAVLCFVWGGNLFHYPSTFTALNVCLSLFLCAWVVRVCCVRGRLARCVR